MCLCIYTTSVHIVIVWFESRSPLLAEQLYLSSIIVKYPTFFCFVHADLPPCPIEIPMSAALILQKILGHRSNAACKIARSNAQAFKPISINSPSELESWADLHSTWSEPKEWLQRSPKDRRRCGRCGFKHWDALSNALCDTLQCTGQDQPCPRCKMNFANPSIIY